MTTIYERFLERFVAHPRFERICVLAAFVEQHGRPPTAAEMRELGIYDEELDGPS